MLRLTCSPAALCSSAAAAIDWIIVGGESGRHARPMHPKWARGLRDQAAAAGVPFLFKQWGEWTEGDAETEVWWVGKKAAGRLLDGVEHLAFPGGGA